VLSDSTEYRRRHGIDDLACVVAADPRHVTDTLRYGVVMITQDLGQGRRALWIFRLGGCFTMYRVRTARPRPLSTGSPR